MFPWTASVYRGPSSNRPTNSTRPRATSSPKDWAKNILFGWLSRKATNLSGQPLRTQRSVRKRNPANTIESQVDKAWSTLFVSCRCKSCWPPTKVGPQLCARRTYDHFHSSLHDFAQVYGSDGPTIFWEMILQEIQQFIVTMEASPAEYSEHDKLVMSQLLERAKRQVNRTTALWGWYAPPQVPGSQQSVYGSMTRCMVPAPAGRGIAGNRVISARRIDPAYEAMKEGLQRPKTRIVKIKSRRLCMRIHHFDASYLERKDAQGAMRMQARWLTGSPVHATRRRSRLWRAITAEHVQYPTFTQQQARWTAAMLGKISAYLALVAYTQLITAKYQWEGASRNQALAVLDRLRTRRDLLVRREIGPDQTTVERRVLCLMTVLRKMVKKYDQARSAFSRGIDFPLGRSELRKLAREIVPGQQDVKLMREMVAKMLDTGS